MVKILFVCLGNICRSPTAEGVCRHVAQQRGMDKRLLIDSAGTSAWHVGEKPDRRASAEAARRGIDLSTQRSRQVEARDFERFDYILAMDTENLRELRQRCPVQYRDKLHRCLDYAPATAEKDVPDPYYGGPGGFAHVFDIIEASVHGLLDEIEQNHPRKGR